MAIKSGPARFWDDLKKGQAAEIEFMEVCPLDLTLSTDRAFDFLTKEGLKVELKTDSYPIDKTPNFFMERFSVLDKESPGGPWQALEKGADIFIYWFQNSNTYYQFNNIPKLVKALDKLIVDIKPFDVLNIRYKTRGYRVQRSRLEKLFDIWEHD